MKVDISDKKELRKFGIVMAVAFLMLSGVRCLIRWWIHHPVTVPWWLIYIAAAFLALGLIAPRALQPVMWVWMKFAEGMNWVMTRVFLILAFALLILPARAILAITRKDLLNRAWLPEAPTYWDEPEEQSKELERYRNQF
jgi:hypothetical protein